MRVKAKRESTRAPQVPMLVEQQLSLLVEEAGDSG